jgi:hypothetical protein
MRIFNFYWGNIDEGVAFVIREELNCAYQYLSVSRLNISLNTCS